MCVGKELIDKALADCGQRYTCKIRRSSDYWNASGDSCVLFLTQFLRRTIGSVPSANRVSRRGSCCLVLCVQRLPGLGLLTPPGRSSAAELLPFLLPRALFV